VKEQATEISNTINESHEPDGTQPSHAVAELGAVEGFPDASMDSVPVTDNEGKSESSLAVCYKRG